MKKKGTVISVSTREASLKRRFRRHLTSLGFQKDVDGVVSILGVSRMNPTPNAGRLAITLKPLDGGEDERYLLAASSEERARDVRTVTVGSPLGQALSGKAVGDKVEYVAPGGTFSYELSKIEAWDGQA